jgi:hypothetical protein
VIVDERAHLGAGDLLHLIFGGELYSSCPKTSSALKPVRNPVQAFFGQGRRETHKFGRFRTAKGTEGRSRDKRPPASSGLGGRALTAGEGIGGQLPTASEAYRRPVAVQRRAWGGIKSVVGKHAELRSPPPHVLCRSRCACIEGCDEGARFMARFPFSSVRLCLLRPHSP